MKLCTIHRAIVDYDTERPSHVNGYDLYSLRHLFHSLSCKNIEILEKLLYIFSSIFKYQLCHFTIDPVIQTCVTTFRTRTIYFCLNPKKQLPKAALGSTRTPTAAYN